MQNVKNGHKRHPAPPLSRRPSRMLPIGWAFSPATMKVAQELYEGVDIDGLGAVGLITYMRTDSLRISAEAQQAAADYVTGKYGADYLPPEPRAYKSKKNAQDAHEAIRPSMPDMTPERVKSSLTADQYKLYRLIWERFIASQMADALLDTVSVDIEADNCMFKATGSTVKFDGPRAATMPRATRARTRTCRNWKRHGDQGKTLEGNQHFTQAPPWLYRSNAHQGTGRKRHRQTEYICFTITTITTHRMWSEGKQRSRPSWVK
ncbi:MAG: DNA topoisomerase [Ruminococcus sp.]